MEEPESGQDPLAERRPPAHGTYEKAAPRPRDVPPTGKEREQIAQAREKADADQEDFAPPATAIIRVRKGFEPGKASRTCERPPRSGTAFPLSGRSSAGSGEPNLHGGGQLPDCCL